jgi:hypothetical protein
MGYVEKDFLMRQFNQLGVVLARILGFKEKGKFEEAQQAIDNAMTVFGLKELDYYLKIDTNSLISELTGPHKLEGIQMKVLGELFYEKGDILQKMGRIDLGRHFFIRALKILDYLSLEERIYSFEREEKIKKIKSILES